MVRKFLDWHAANPRDLVAVEQALKVRIGQVEITGRVDRLESDDQGRAVVVDLKTGASAPREDELDRHPQLGVYQLAVLIGAFEQFGLSEPGGAELVQVGKAAADRPGQGAAAGRAGRGPGAAWAKDLVETVAAGMAGPVFPPGSTPAAAPARSRPAARSTPRASRSRRNGQPGQGVAGLVRDGRRHLVHAQHVPQRLGVGDVLGLRRGHGHVRHHAGALPVRAGHRVDRPRERDADVHRAG